VRPKGKHHPHPTGKEVGRGTRVWKDRSAFDTDGARMGKRRAKRDVTCEWARSFNYMRTTFEHGSYLRGRGLAKRPQKFALYVQGKVRGYTDDINHAIAWQRAARLAGHDSAKCVQLIAF
jgi:hypothetical protein